MTRINQLWAVGLLGSLAVTALHADNSAQPKPGESKLTRQLQFSACYVKEDADRAWQIRIVADMPRGPGVYVIVYNETGEVVFRAAVPFGKHTAEKPYTIDVPKDGKAQQYVIKFMGQQDNLNAMVLPLTDLPFEVYGDSSFSFGYGTSPGLRRIVAFQTPASGEPLWFNGWSGNYRILDENGAVLVDSKQQAMKADDKQKKGGPRETETIVTLPPGKTYWLDPYDVMYLGVQTGRLYLTFEPQRWFEPKLNWTLQDRPWWKGMP